MNDDTIAKAAKGKRALTQEIASRSTDPAFYSALQVLPNPDVVLRRLGRSHEVFDAIFGDAHVMGELRAVRSGLLRYEWRLQPGGETPADLRALELCQRFMDTRPAPGMRWADTIWNMSQAVFYGHRVHEVVWGRSGNELMPVKIVDRPNRRFAFDNENNLRLKTKAHPLNGELLGDKKILLSRHMPSSENPYGVAVFSSCFWPYTFKHAGWKYFNKFCEKYGIPWAIGKHPRGVPQGQIDELVDSLAQMVEDGVAAIPDDGSVDLLTAKSSGQLPQERMIDLANREISKALTSQTLATEIQGEGSRAASETHRDREEGVSESDREIPLDTINELLTWITELNVAGAVPPTIEFYEEMEAQTEMVDFIDRASTLIDIPKAWAHARLQVPEPEPGDEVLERRRAATTPPAPGQPEFSSHSCPNCNNTDFAGDENDEIDEAISMAADEADAEVENIVDQAGRMLAQFEAEGKSLAEFSTALDVMLKGQPGDLATKARNAMFAAMLQGADDAS